MDTTEVIVSSSLKDETSTACVWDANNGTLLARYRGGGFPGPHGLCSSGGYLLGCEQGKPMLHLWQYNKQHCENKRLLAPGKVCAVSFSPDAYHIALSIDEKIYLYQTSSGRLLGIGSRHFQPVTVIKFSDDSTLLCCGGKDGLITIWNISVFCVSDSSPEPYLTFSDHSLPISDLIITTGSVRSRVISVSADKTCRVYDLVSGGLLISFVLESRLSSVTISPVELEVYIGDWDGQIHEISLRNPPRMLEYHVSGTEKKNTFYGHLKVVNCLVFSINSCNLISGSDDETIKIWHIESRNCIRTILMKGPVTNLLYLLLPKSVFSHDFKPSTIINDFRNPANIDEDEEHTFDIVIAEDMISPPSVSVSPVAFENNRSFGNEREINKLKCINNELFKFAIKCITNKKSEESDSTIRPFPKKRHKKTKNSL